MIFITALILQLLSYAFAQNQIHIALAGNDIKGNSNRYTVSWYTSTKVPESWLQYTCSFGKPNILIKANSTEYLQGYGFHHHATTKNITETLCTYKVGNTEKWSQSYTFQMPPNDFYTPFSVSMFGDMGYLGSKERPTLLPFNGLVSNWTAVPTRDRLVTLVDNKVIDLMIMLGDISYADDGYSKNPFIFEYEKVYNGYMNWMQPVTAMVPFMTVPGNHESECHSAVCFLWRETYNPLGNFTAYNTRFRMPSLESRGAASMWYSFNYGGIHFVMMNTETDFKGASEQNHGRTWPAGHFAPEGTYVQWLENDLMYWSDKRPWIVAVGHRPLFDLPSIFRHILERNGVDLYVCGHIHEYLRYKPYHNMTQIIVGSAGSDEMRYIHQAEHKKISNLHSVEKHIPKVLATGLLHYLNSTCLKWTLVASETGEILDHVYLHK